MTKMKTTNQLGISIALHIALKAVKKRFEAGGYVHLSGAAYNDGPPRAVKWRKPRFNMGTNCEYIANTSCGTVACIGGAAALEMGMSVDEADNHVVRARGRVRKLYYLPNDVDGKYDDVTPKIAAKAIGNFLKTGDPDWKKILKEV